MQLVDIYAGGHELKEADWQHRTEFSAIPRQRLPYLAGLNTFSTKIFTWDNVPIIKTFRCKLHMNRASHVTEIINILIPDTTNGLLADDTPIE